MNANFRQVEGTADGDPFALPNIHLRVGEHVIDVGALRVTTRPDSPRLTGKAMAVLVELARHAGSTLTREQLLARVWRDRVTTPDVLTQAIKELRRVFGDDAKPSRYIETIPRVGYRLIAEVDIPQDAIVAPVTTVPHLVPAEQPARIDHGRIDHEFGERMKGRRSTATIVIALLVAGMAIVAAWRVYGRIPVQQFPWRVSDLKVVTSDPGAELRPHISPDGSRVAYSHPDATTGLARINVRVIGDSTSIQFASAEPALEVVPTWSPDGRQIVLEKINGESCELAIVPSMGGDESDVGRCGNYMITYFDWTPDGKALITADTTDTADGIALLRWDLATGRKTKLDYDRPADEKDLEAHYSPDGKWLAFRRGLSPYSDLWVMPASGGPPRQITTLASRIRGYTWAADSSALVFASNYEGRFQLYAVDLADLSVQNLGVAPAMYPDAAKHVDTIVYEIPKAASGLGVVMPGSDMVTPTPLANSTGSDSDPALAPAGDRIAFISDRSGTQQVWLLDIRSGASSRLTDFPPSSTLLGPAWSADALHLLVTVRSPHEISRLAEIEISSRRWQIVSDPKENIARAAYGPDPDTYLLLVGTLGSRNKLILQHRDGGARTTIASGVETMQCDPAAKRIYYTRQAGLFARSLEGGDEQFVTPSISANTLDGWRMVGSRIWYVTDPDNRPTEIDEFDPANGSSRMVVRMDSSLTDLAFDVSSSGDRVFLTPQKVDDTDVGAFMLTRMSKR